MEKAIYNEVMILVALLHTRLAFGVKGRQYRSCLISFVDAVGHMYQYLPTAKQLLFLSQVALQSVHNHVASDTRDPFICRFLPGLTLITTACLS